jgi:hypothetical protein
MQQIDPESDSDDSFDIAAIEAQIERSLNLNLETKYTEAIKQFRELSKRRSELKKNKTTDPIIARAKRDVKQQRKAAQESFIQLAKDYEKDADDFITWAINKNPSLIFINSWSNLKKKKITLFVCCLMTCAATFNEATVFANIGGKATKSLLQRLHSLIEPWYMSYTSESPKNTDETVEAPKNTIETAEVMHVEVCKMLPSLKEAMEAVDQASLKLSIAKQMLREVIKHQDDELQMAKAMMKSLD